MDLTHLSSQLKIKTDFNAGSSLGLRNINSITGIVDNSVTSLQALIFPNANPEYDDIDPTNFDITGITSGNKCFVFDIKKEYKFTLSSDITDHYVENNLAIQDQIGLKPIILEVTGCIGEVDLSSRTTKNKSKNENKIASEIGMNNEKGNIFNSVDAYLGRMGSLTSFAPNIVNQAYDIYNSAKFAYSTASKTMNLDKQSSSQSGFEYTEGYDKKVILSTKQFTWIDWFKTRWWNRASFTIVTPYGVLENMYIMDLNASQPDNTRYVTNLNIKFKQIRKAYMSVAEAQAAQTREEQLNKITENQGEVETDIIIANKAWYGENLTSDTLNNQSVTIANDKYSVGKSHNTATASFNVKGATKNKSVWSRLINQIKGKEKVEIFSNIGE